MIFFFICIIHFDKFYQKGFVCFFIFLERKYLICLLSHAKYSFKHMSDIITSTVRKAFFFMSNILVNIVEGY
jgi:hypothetical protein